MKWKSVLLLLLLLLTSRLRNKTTGFAQRKFAFWQRPGLKNSASNAKISESYEERNESFLQPKQFCHLGHAFSCCCSDKTLLLRELSFQPGSVNFAFKKDCRSPPISLLHSFPVFAAHIFTVSTFSQLWIQTGKLWTAWQGLAVSLWRQKVLSFSFLSPPSTENFIQAPCYHLITQHLEHTRVSSTNTVMEWEWMQEGMRSLKEEHPNAL